MQDFSLPQVGKYLLIAFAAYFGINSAIFILFYGDTLTSWQLPYTENFDQLERLDYRQFGGFWKVQDGLLVQTIEDDTDLMAVIPMQLQSKQPYRFQVHLEFLSGAQGGGLMFNLQHPDNRQQSHMVRFGSDQGQGYLIYGYFDDQTNYVTQGEVRPFDLASGADLAVEVGETSYNVVVNGISIAAGVPLIYNGGRVAFTTWFSQVAFDNVAIDLWTPTALTEASPTAIPSLPANIGGFSDHFDDLNSQSQWLPFSGSWSFEPGALVQTNPSGFDYSISHTGTFEQFTLRAQFSQRQGAGAGVLFNMSQANSARGAHMVRYQDDNQLVWGYYDAEGVFQGQGNLPITPPGTTSHILEVEANLSTYSIHLDGQPIAENVELRSASGFIGLTTSNSVAAFEQVQILANTAPETSIASPQNSSGDWIQENNLTIQRTSALADFYRSLGVHGETFEVSVDIGLADAASDQIGAGLVFNASDPNAPVGGYAVRLLASNQVVWGVIDAQAGFQAEGSAPVQLTADKHALMLRVRQNDYDIVLDGELVAGTLPLATTGGWIFFNAFGGPVTFANFAVNLTQIG